MDKNKVVDILKEEYGIVVKQEDNLPDIKRDNLMKIDKSEVGRITSALSIAPQLGANAANLKNMGKQAYSITLNGKDIMPDQLWQKKNGGLMSFLKTEGSSAYGKSVDINAIDTTVAQTATIAASVFSVASVATSQYYLKNIDEKLEALTETTNKILEFLERDKQSGIEQGVSTLKEILTNIESIKSNKDTKTLKLNQVATIQNKAGQNIRFYYKEINGLVDTLMKKGQKSKEEKEKIEDLKTKYNTYQMCLQEYAVSRLVETVLTDNYSESYLSNIKEELEKCEADYKELSDKIVANIFGHNYSKFSTKAKLGLANTLDFAGKVVQATPLGKTQLDEKLISKSSEIPLSVFSDTKNLASSILTEKDYEIIKPYRENIETMKAMVMKPVELYYDGEDMYLGVLH